MHSRCAQTSSPHVCKSWLGPFAPILLLQAARGCNMVRRPMSDAHARQEASTLDATLGMLKGQRLKMLG
eukprot:1021128-Alexandrium_andersonii.AAC.1